MLKIYLSTVAIYAIVILCVCILLKEKIAENGWVAEKDSGIDKWTMLFCISAIPVFRSLFIVVAFAMAHAKKGEAFWEDKNDD